MTWVCKECNNNNPDSATECELCGCTERLEVAVAAPVTASLSLTRAEALRLSAGGGSVYIEGCYKTIEASAFKGQRSITSVTLEAGVDSIRAHAFEGCTNLTTVTVEGDLSLIGVSAFDGCTSLRHFTVGGSIRTISDKAFHNCRALTAKPTASRVAASAFLCDAPSSSSSSLSSLSARAASTSFSSGSRPSIPTPPSRPATSTSTTRSTSTSSSSSSYSSSTSHSTSSTTRSTSTYSSYSTPSGSTTRSRRRFGSSLSLSAKQVVALVICGLLTLGAIGAFAAIAIIWGDLFNSFDWGNIVAAFGTLIAYLVLLVLPKRRPGTLPLGGASIVSLAIAFGHLLGHRYGGNFAGMLFIPILTIVFNLVAAIVNWVRRNRNLRAAHFLMALSAMVGFLSMGGVNLDLGLDSDTAMYLLGTCMTLGVFALSLFIRSLVGMYGRSTSATRAHATSLFTGSAIAIINMAVHNALVWTNYYMAAMLVQIGVIVIAFLRLLGSRGTSKAGVFNSVVMLLAGIASTVCIALPDLASTWWATPPVMMGFLCAAFALPLLYSLDKLISDRGTVMSTAESGLMLVHFILIGLIPRYYEGFFIPFSLLLIGFCVYRAVQAFKRRSIPKRFGVLAVLRAVFTLISAIVAIFVMGAEMEHNWALFSSVGIVLSLVSLITLIGKYLYDKTRFFAYPAHLIGIGVVTVANILLFALVPAYRTYAIVLSLAGAIFSLAEGIYDFKDSEPKAGAVAMVELGINAILFIAVMVTSFN